MGVAGMNSEVEDGTKCWWGGTTVVDVDVVVGTTAGAASPPPMAPNAVTVVAKTA